MAKIEWNRILGRIFQYIADLISRPLQCLLLKMSKIQTYCHTSVNWKVVLEPTTVFSSFFKAFSKNRQEARQLNVLFTFLHHNSQNLYSRHMLILYFAQYFYRFFIVAFIPRALCFSSLRIIKTNICIHRLGVHAIPDFLRYHLLESVPILGSFVVQFGDH